MILHLLENRIVITNLNKITGYGITQQLTYQY